MYPPCRSHTLLARGVWARFGLVDDNAWVDGRRHRLRIRQPNRSVSPGVRPAPRFVESGLPDFSCCWWGACRASSSTRVSMPSAEWRRWPGVGRIIVVDLEVVEQGCGEPEASVPRAGVEQLDLHTRSRMTAVRSREIPGTGGVPPTSSALNWPPGTRSPDSAPVGCPCYITRSLRRQR